MKGSSRPGRRGPASGIHTLMLAYRRARFGPKSRWHIRGDSDRVAEQLEASGPIIVSSAVVWAVFNHHDLPADDYARGEKLERRYWLVDEFDGLSEWTDEHPADDPDDPGHCGGGRTWGVCDPGRTGVQTIDSPRAQEQHDWTFFEWQDDDACPESKS